MCGQQVRGVAGYLAPLYVACGCAQVSGRHLQFLRGMEGFGGSLRAKVCHAPV